MKIAILSDIHSNCYALEAVINDFDKHKIEQVIVLGDIFGYYPWACETYKLLKPFLPLAFSIKGNHDQLVLDDSPPDPAPSYWQAAKLNEHDLNSHMPEALAWLRTLEYKRSFELGGKCIHMIHGTPDDPAMGRYYVDNAILYDWLPKKNEILMLGHTHYPFIKDTTGHGIIFNPGSVGQPRDGIPMPSWGIWDVNKFEFSLMRTVYNNISVMKELERINWEKRSILALNKTHKGAL